MAFEMLESALAGSTGGTVTETVVDGATFFPLIEAADHETVEPNTVTGGALYKKVFVRSKNMLPVNNCKIFVGNLLDYVAVSVALGTESDITPPADNMFSVGEGEANGIAIGDFTTLETRAIWIKLSWGQNSGAWNPQTVRIGVTGSIDAGSFTFTITTQVYKAAMPIDTDNDYTSFIKDIFIIFLRNAFYRFPRPDLQWNPIRDYTKLAILDQMAFNMDEPDFLPAIIVKRRPISWGDLFWDQKLLTADVNSTAGIKSDLLFGSMDLYCVCREDLHAEFLGASVFKAVKMFKDELRKMGIFDIKRVVLGELMVDEQDSRHASAFVPVTVTYSFQDSWLYKDLNYLNLTGIDFQFSGTATSCGKK